MTNNYNNTSSFNDPNYNNTNSNSNYTSSNNNNNSSSNNEYYGYSSEFYQANDVNFEFEHDRIIRKALTPCDRNATIEKEESASQDDRGRKKLIIACFVCTCFMVTEFVGGYLAQSLAIMSDAAHMAADLMTFIVSLWAVTLTTKGRTKHFTYGYHRAEILGALFSISSLWIVTFWLLIEAIKRLIDPSLNENLNAGWMTTIASFGIFFNLVLVYVLHGPGIFKGEHTHCHGHGHSHGGGAAGDHEEDHEGGHGHSHASGSHGHSHVNNDTQFNNGGGAHNHSHGNGSSSHGHSHGSNNINSHNNNVNSSGNHYDIMTDNQNQTNDKLPLLGRIDELKVWV